MSADIGFDWDDFHEEHPFAEKAKRRFGFHNAGLQVEHKDWIIPGFVGLKDLVVAYGPPESGKSTFAVDLACRMAAGIDFDGKDIWARFNVLYVARERARQVRRRADAFCKHHGGPRFDNLLIYDGPLDLMRDGELTAVARMAAWEVQGTLKEDYIDVVIIDTLAAAMSASDSSPDAMARAVGNLSQCQRMGDLDDDGGPTIVVVHHSPGNGEDRMRGATQLLGAADTTIAIAKKHGVVTAQVRKSNDLSPSDKPVRRFSIETVSFGKNDEGIETTAPVLVPAKAEHKKPDKPAAASQSRTHSKAAETLRAAIAANDNKPVTETQWRAASDSTAGNISAAGKRKRFDRAKAIIGAGLAVEEAGLFSLSGDRTKRDKRGQLS